MRCILCLNYSFSIICKTCQQNFLAPNTTQRLLDDGFKVYSFYRYKEIQELLKTKHTHIGAAIYKILAKNSFTQFKKDFTFEEKVGIIPVDDISKSGYAHTAILAKALSSSKNKIYYHSLRADNKVNYSGKSLAFRLANKRDFSFSVKGKMNMILVDDIITTGTTLLEAKSVIEKAGSTPIFALTLADARDL